jgi:hypothetical protein
MLSDPEWFYEVPIVHKTTGEQRVVVVKFTADERQFCLHNFGEYGPPTNRFAMDHAEKLAPSGFVVAIEGIKRVTVH